MNVEITLKIRMPNNSNYSLKPLEGTSKDSIYVLRRTSGTTSVGNNDTGIRLHIEISGNPQPEPGTYHAGLLLPAFDAPTLGFSAPLIIPHKEGIYQEDDFNRIRFNLTGTGTLTGTIAHLVFPSFMMFTRSVEVSSL